MSSMACDLNVNIADFSLARSVDVEMIVMSGTLLGWLLDNVENFRKYEMHFAAHLNQSQRHRYDR